MKTRKLRARCGLLLALSLMLGCSSESKTSGQGSPQGGSSSRAGQSNSGARVVGSAGTNALAVTATLGNSGTSAGSTLLDTATLPSGTSGAGPSAAVGSAGGNSALTTPGGGASPGSSGASVAGRAAIAAGGTAVAAGGASAGYLAAEAGASARSGSTDLANAGAGASARGRASGAGGQTLSGGRSAGRGRAGATSRNTGGTPNWTEADFVSQRAWKLVYVDSQETIAENGRAQNAFDNNILTFWHTQYTGKKPAPPHEIQIDLGDTYNLVGMQYTPRQDKDINGTVAGYEFYVSDSTDDWGDPVATGTFGSGRTPKRVTFPAKSGRYIRFVAVSEVNHQVYTSVAELDVVAAQ